MAEREPAVHPSLLTDSGFSSGGPGDVVWAAYAPECHPNDTAFTTCQRSESSHREATDCASSEVPWGHICGLQSLERGGVVMVGVFLYDNDPVEERKCIVSHRLDAMPLGIEPAKTIDLHTLQPGGPPRTGFPQLEEPGIIQLQPLQDQSHGDRRRISSSLHIKCVEWSLKPSPIESARNTHIGGSPEPSQYRYIP
jgi:hypothetical protein